MATRSTHKAPLVAANVGQQVNFKGKSIINHSDLISLQGGHVITEDNYLTNFLIDTFLEILQEARADGLKKGLFPWEIFDKSSVDLSAKGRLLEQDIILVPYNPQGGMHWFLVAVFPQVNLMAALDIKAGDFVKPTAKAALLKMLGLLQNAESSLDVDQ